MIAYSLWENTQTNVIYRVADSCLSKRAVSGTVLSIDQFFLGQNNRPTTPAPANTSDLRAWLNSIPSV